MPVDLPLSRQLARARWKVKIFDKENREPPHITVIRGTEKWRIDLRKRAFMDRYPPPREVDERVIAAIQESWALLCAEWDRIHPDNPVEGTEDEDA